MNVIGVVCEYNPMHLGHLYQIKEIKRMYPDSVVVIVAGSCFTQRGDICLINKWNKCKIALNNDIDLVIELPFVFSTQSADIFAKGAVSLLNYLGVDTIVFGSESNDISMFESIVRTQLFDKNYDTIVKKYLDTGINYPTAMSKALKDILGYTINEPNDILAISYIKEIIKNNYNINFVSIKRTNSYHGQSVGNDFIVNASLIRKLHNNGEDVSNYIVKDSYSYLYKNLSIKNCFSYLKYQIINQDISNIQTVDEGIHNKLKKEIIYCNSYDELITKIKSKRYTYNKISRMLLHILTNFTKDEADNISIDYIRLLGFSENGQQHLNKIKKNLNIPIITNYRKNISAIFDIEYRITCIYSILVNDMNLAKEEFCHKPIIKNN